MGMFERADGVGLPESNIVLPQIVRKTLSLRGHRARHAIQCLLGNSGDLTSSSIMKYGGTTVKRRKPNGG
jgi:hypothetical protein